MSRWFRHYAGMARDEKLVRVALKSKQPIERVVWVWAAVLESAAEIDADGRFELDPAEVSYFLRTDEADVVAILDGLASLGRLSADRVVKWCDRQFKSDRSVDRVRAHRERKRNADDNSAELQPSRNADVTLQERHCNSPETETETETEVDASASTERAGASQAPGDKTPEIELRRRIVKAYEPDLPPDTHYVAVWLGMGLDPNICAGVVEASCQRGKKPKTLKYFDEQIREAQQKRAQGPPVQNNNTPWELLVQRFTQGKGWPAQAGPSPDRDGCRCPKEILAQYEHHWRPAA